VVLVVDTHALVWYLSASPKLSTKVKKLLRSPTNSLIVPSIVLVETKYLYSKRRITVSLDEIREVVDKDERCNIYPLDETVLDYLPEDLDIHDGILCATVLALRDTLGEKVGLVTRDDDITTSKLVKTIW
jgi:PIN domain nuclease of toxin-antitoxin system